MPIKEPDFQDYVKHVRNTMAGTVIAKYPVNGVQHLDVRGIDDRIYYQTPAKNWEVIRTLEEFEGIIDV